MEYQNHTTEYIKRQANKLKKELEIPHHEALDKAAKKNGFSNYKNFLNKQQNQNSPIKNNKKDTKTMTFTQWLRKQQKRKSPLGDLARDAISDSSWPNASDLETYNDHLLSMSACSNALAALKKAWKTYKNFLKRSENPSLNKQYPQKNCKGRRVTFIKNIKPLHFSKRTVEKFSIGDEAWISWGGKKAIPVIITEVDDRYYTFKIERPLKKAGDECYLRLDEVRSTPELACINLVS